MGQLFLDRGRRSLRDDEEYNAARDGGGNSYDETEWFPCTCCRTTQLTGLVGSLVTFRDVRSKDMIGRGGEASLQDRPWLAIGSQRACPTRPKGAAYSVGGGGRGKKGKLVQIMRKCNEYIEDK